MVPGLEGRHGLLCHDLLYLCETWVEVARLDHRRSIYGFLVLETVGPLDRVRLFLGEKRQVVEDPYRHQYGSDK